MRHKVLLLLVSVAAGGIAPLQAQVPDWVRDILLAAQLPVVTTEARREGIPNAEVVAVLDAMKTAGVPAFDAKVILDSARAARRDNGPADNFGAFVQAQLASGKRGTALAAAIRAEHARQGKGRPGGVKGRGVDDGRSPNAGNREGRGRSANPQTPADTGAARGNRGRGRPPLTQGDNR